MKTEATDSEKAEELTPADSDKFDSKLLEKKEASDDEEMEEERSWRHV